MPAAAGKWGMNGEDARVLRAREVTARTGLSRTTIWRLERQGQFPARRQLSLNAVGWIASEIERWIAERATPIGSG